MAETPIPSIIYENSDFLALNKPAGVLVHGIGASHAKNEETVVDWVLERYPQVKGVGDLPAGRQVIQERPGIVHRLDKDTSGVLLVAKNQKTFDFFKKLFQEHKIKKTYTALVHGKMGGRGVINIPIGLHGGSVKHGILGKNLRMTKEAVTEYQSLHIFECGGSFFTLVRLTPRTGRTHQLRVHCATKGNPIVGDQLYGKQLNPWNLKRQFLHAEAIEFNLADGGRIKLEADLPEDLEKILKSLENKMPPE